MQKIYNIYHNLGYWFLLLILLIVPAFFTTYFTTLFDGHLPIIHIHFVLVMLWIALLIAQPFLIKFRKFSIHRLLSKVSYVLVPVVLISAFLMIRISHYRQIEIRHAQVADGVNQNTNAQILQHAADFQAIAVFYVLWFAIFLFARHH